jgi:hypothetical protein
LGLWNSGSVTSLVTFPNWPGALSAISFYLYEAVSGEDPKTALNMAVQKIGQLGRLTF